MAGNSITVRYKCKCMAAEEGVDVPCRREGEDMERWMDSCLGVAIYLDHRMRSPRCAENVMEYAKLPVPENAPFLGGKPEVN